MNGEPLAYGRASLRIRYPLVCRATFTPGKSLSSFTDERAQPPPVSEALEAGGEEKGRAMSTKLLKTKWYIVNLSTKIVAVDRVYNGFWQAVETERERGRMQRFTAMRGSHITLHAGKPWIIPMSLEEAMDEYMAMLADD